MDRTLGLPRRAAAEMIATFTLVFAVCGAVIANGRDHEALGAVGISLVVGLIVTAMVYAIGHLSGAHFNPAVTIAFTLTRHFSARDAIAYVAAQVLGATLAALVLLAVWGTAAVHLGVTEPSIDPVSALIYETLLTAMLMFVIMAVATDTRAVGTGAAIAIGAAITADVLLGGGVTGASMNPARSFGPALVAGDWHEFWVYLAGPILGAALGAITYQFVRGGRASSTHRVTAWW